VQKQEVPKTSFGHLIIIVEHVVFALFLIIIIKSPNKVWRLIVFAPFLIIIIIILYLLLRMNLSDQIHRDSKYSTNPP
jgi:uncharacterized protein (DUF983 family)